MARGEGWTVNRSVNGRRAIEIYNKHMRPHAPLCGAKAKSTGEPCRRAAMENGRCDVHGGKTGKGDNWHKPRWPDRNAPDAEEKLSRKLADLERAYALRKKRLAKMTEGRRAEYDRWLKTHSPGPAAQRQVARDNRRQNAAARAMHETEQPPVISPELEKLEQLIAVLEADLAVLKKTVATDIENSDDTPTLNLGIFG